MRTATCRVDSPEEWRSPPGPARVQHSDPTTLRGRRSFPGTADNKLLAHLPPEVFARLALYLQPVRLERQQVLFRAQEPLKFVYFPDTAVVSIVSRLESGHASAVGLVPYTDTQFNRASFPLKTLEYLAAGLPVVSSDLPSVRWLATDQVEIAGDPHTFGDAVDRAVEQSSDPALREQRQSFARGHDWANRVATLAAALGLSAPDRRATE